MDTWHKDDISFKNFYESHFINTIYNHNKEK